jgi:hypothetical protein
VVVQFLCHPETPSFGERGIWASRAMFRVLCETTMARVWLASSIKLHHYQLETKGMMWVVTFDPGRQT